MRSTTRAVAITLVALLCFGAAHARKDLKIAKNRLFPALDNCKQAPDSTAFRINMNTTKIYPANTVCFGFSTGTPTAPTSKCGAATTLERVQVWASHATRGNITSMSIRDNAGSKTVFGAWVKKGASMDELVFSRLAWTPAYIAASNPRICLTLDHDSDLDELCMGPEGKCTIGLYSIGNKGEKCCPVYAVPVVNMA